MTSIPPLKKDPTSPAPPPARKCADCGVRFKGHDTSWDIHLGGTTYKTICTACFEKNDTGWAETSEGTRKKTVPKRRS